MLCEWQKEILSLFFFGIVCRKWANFSSSLFIRKRVAALESEKHLVSIISPAERDDKVHFNKWFRIYTFCAAFRLHLSLLGAVHILNF